MNHSNYSETIRYRCLNEHYPHQLEDIYLTLCGIEECTSDKKRIDRVREGYHLHVIMSGEGMIEIGNYRQRLHAGQLFIIKPGMRIAYWPVAENPWIYCWMSFNGDKAADFACEAGFVEDVFAQDCHVDDGLFFKLCDEVLNTPKLNSASAMKRLGLLLEFIGLAIESSELESKQGSRREHQPLYHRSEYVRHAIDYIQNNYASITVTDVANYLGIDRSYFSSIFRQSQGISPSEFLLRVRMKECSHMLLNLTMSIQEIARYVGYEDSLTFSKAFKRFFGMSPKYYREMPVDARPDMETIIAARMNKKQQE